MYQEMYLCVFLRFRRVSCRNLSSTNSRNDNHKVWNRESNDRIKDVVHHGEVHTKNRADQQKLGLGQQEGDMNMHIGSDPTRVYISVFLLIFVAAHNYGMLNQCRSSQSWCSFHLVLALSWMILKWHWKQKRWPSLTCLTLLDGWETPGSSFYGSPLRDYGWPSRYWAAEPSALLNLKAA